MSTDKSFFYIGYPKSGATRLRSFLEGYEGVTLLKLGPSGISRDLIGAPAPIAYREDEAEIHVRKVLADCPAGKPRFIFSERLAGLYYCGHYDALAIANRIHRFCPEARVVITIREQKSIISSIYRWYVRNGGTVPPEQFLNPREDITYPRFSWQAYEYHHLIFHYARLFGRENVLVLPQEDLRKSIPDYFKTFCDFAGIDCPEKIADQISNPGISNKETETRRLVNLFRKNTEADAFRDPTPLQNPVLRAIAQPFLGLVSAVTGGQDRHVRFIRENFTGKYCESNNLLSDYLGRDLSLMGYEM
ncbi:MAG: hypothetical protein WCH43_04300 [Verrucomicrobiota bacterium]